MRKILFRILSFAVFLDILNLIISLNLASKQEEFSGYNNYANTTFHTVEQGDTIDYIAKRYNTTFEAVAYSNYFVLNPYLLYPGEVLYIPTNRN
jgi:hypothetical protein